MYDVEKNMAITVAAVKKKKKIKKIALFLIEHALTKYFILENNFGLIFLFWLVD